MLSVVTKINFCRRARGGACNVQVYTYKNVWAWLACQSHNVSGVVQEFDSCVCLVSKQARRTVRPSAKKTVRGWL